MAFRRTNEEIKAGLSKEQAMAMRSMPASSKNGEIIIRIRPAAGVDPDYFEHIRQNNFEVIVDNHWYKWLDTRASVPYDMDMNKLMNDLVNMGMNEMVNKHSI